MTPLSYHSSNLSLVALKTMRLLVPILKRRGHGAIFTCDCKNLLKTYFCCSRARKLPHAPKLYFANFYRAFKKSLLQCLYQSY